MKKVICILVLICVFFGAAFAQQKPATPAPAPAPAKPAAPAPAPAAAPAASSTRANAIGADVFQLVKGFIASDKDTNFSVFAIVAGYERLITPHYSIGADAETYFIKSKILVNSIDSTYFSIALAGRYYPSSEGLDKFFIGTTLGYSQLSIDGSTKTGFSGLSTSLKMGYKVITKSGLFLEPSLAYVLQKTSTFSGTTGIPLGWNGGLRLGWAF